MNERIKDMLLRPAFVNTVMNLSGSATISFSRRTASCMQSYGHSLFNLLKCYFSLNCERIENFISYITEDTLFLYYKYQSIDAVQGNGSCLL